MGDKKTIIIIPAHNEEKSLPAVLQEIKNSVPYADIVVVDDGSTDATSKVAEDAGAHAITLPFNMGYGAALQTGFKYAKRKGYDVAIQMDADGQHEVASLPDLINALDEKTDFALGSRFLEKHSNQSLDQPYKVSLLRRIGMIIFGSIASTIVGKKISDPTSGFQAMNRDVINLYASDAYPLDYPDADVLIMLHRAGFRIKEIPVKMYQNTEGKSMHSGFKPVYYVFKMCLSILTTLLRKWPKGES